MKAKITIPKEKEDCKNGKCGHEHEHVIDLPEPPPKPSTIEIIPGSNQQQLQQIQQQVPPPPAPATEKPKKLQHEEIAELMPKGTNFMSCPGGDCGHKKLKNPKQIKKFKTCPNGDCGSNTVPKKNEFCPTCGKDFDKDEELEDGVELQEDDEE